MLSKKQGELFDLFRKKMKNADHLLINTFADEIANIGELLLDLSVNTKWNPEKEN